MVDVILEKLMARFEEFCPTIDFDLRFINKDDVEYMLDHIHYEIFLKLPTLPSKEYALTKIGFGAHATKQRLESRGDARLTISHELLRKCCLSNAQ